jgi:predicted nucleic acid-binding protein
MSGEAPQGVLLDSVILIDHFNGVPSATACLRKLGPRAYLSVITLAEVLVGFDEPGALQARRLLDRLPLLDIDGPTARRAAALRRARGWKLPDALQAAVALQHGLRLATRNTKDFDPGRDAFVVIPYVL